MKKLLLISIFVSFVVFADAQTPDWEWARSAGGTSYDEAYSVAVDAIGNSYLAGYFLSPSITFGTTTLTNAARSNFFLVKYDPAGNVLWAKSAGGRDNDCWATSVAVDASGNVFLGGCYASSTISFDSITFTNANAGLFNADIFLTKYDANGNLKWAKSVGGIGDDRVNSVALNASGDLFIAGYFQAPNIIFDTITLTSAGWQDIFIVKYDTAGNVHWAKSIGGDNYEQATSVAVDASGNAYLTGFFDSSYIIFGTTILTNASVGNGDIFLAKYDANGNVLWATSTGETSSDESNSVATDTSGNIFITGYFYGSTISFGSTTLTNTIIGFGDIFLVKYNAIGNVVWAKSEGGNGTDWGCSVAVDISGNSYLAGWYSGSTTIIDTITLASTGSPDISISKYDTNGNVLWAKGAGGNSSDRAYSAAVDASGAVYLAGGFYSPSINFGGTTLLNTNSTGDSVDVFLTKLNSSNGINESISLSAISLYPNPAADIMTIETPQKATFEILSIHGQLIKTFETYNTKTNIDVSALPAGMYIVEVRTEKGIAVKKFVKE